MGKVARIALQGVYRRLSSGLPLFFLVFTTMSGSPAIAADDSVACRSPIARVVSIQGTIEVRRSGSAAAWATISWLDTTLCPGDRLRTGAQSRAALFVQPETLVRIDQSTTIVIGANPDEPVFEFIQNDVMPVSAGDHACGAGYFVTRFPKKFRVRTPHFDAAVEGTEFLVALRCETTDLSVIEGKVLASSSGASSFPSQSVVSGQTLTVGSDTPPGIKVLIKPADAVQWTLYYPPLTPAGTVVPEDCRTVPVDNRASCLIAQAEQFLRAGRADEAQAHMVDALSGAPASSDAKALSSIISLVKNDKVEALRLAKDSVDASPNSAPAWLALSYAQQADFKLEAALSSAQRATELTPSSALALARVAELQLSLGWTREAEKTAKQAVAANPSESRAHMILGFVHLAQINVKEAREDFEHAIELDSTDPLPRLGLGLAIIRKGNFVDGREQIEIAVALDPTNSLVRSYIGKAYYEENKKERDKLAETQFGIAKQMDPRDPTPWFYDAILKQTQNQPIGALEDLQKSIELNDNRAVYRSRLVLDEDRAARSASLARTYQSLGLSEAALAEAAKSLAADPANYSAHRFLADTYALLPRQEINRASELLQAQLHQPLGSVPLQPQLANDDLLPLRSSGISTGGLNEYNPLFERDGLHLQLYGLKGNDDTRGDQEIISGLVGVASFGASQSRFNSMGFRANNDRHKTIDDAFLQVRLNESVSAQIEASRLDQTNGDLRVAFDPTFDDLSRFQTQVEIYRLGIRAKTSTNSEVLLSAYHSLRYDALTAPGFDPILTQRGVGDRVEIAHVLATPSARLVSGVNYFDAEKTDGGLVIGPPTIFRPFHFNAYTYASVPLPPLKMSVQVGLSFDHLRSQETGDLQRTNPKFGLLWLPTESTTVRIANVRTLHRHFMTDQGLEPTQVAGFAQFYDDREGATARRTAVSVDHRFSNYLFTGASLGKRYISSPIIIDLPTNQRDFDQWTEKEGGAYLSWAPTRSVLVTAEARWERFERPFRSDSLGFIVVDTWYYPLSLRWFAAAGFSSVLTATYVDQKGQFFDVSQTIFDGRESFWVTDFLIDYRLPRRTGTLSAGVRNAFAEKFRFQSTEPDTTRVAMDRQVFVRVSLAF